MAQPSKYPRWDDVNPTGNITEPTEPKKDTGWAVGERPAAQHWNWLFNLIYQWIVWLAGWTTRTFVLGAPHCNPWHDATETWVLSASGGKLGLKCTVFGSGAGSLYVNVPCIPGDRLVSVTFYVKDANGAGGTVTCNALYVDNTGVNHNLANANTPATGDQTVTLAAINHTVGAGESLLLNVVSITTVNSIFYRAEVTMDRP